MLDTAKIMGITLSEQERRDIGTPHTRSYAAAVHYGMALDALDAGNWENAKDLFTKALEADPQFELAKRGLAGCPGGGAPTIGQLASMAPSQIADMADGSIELAMSRQAEADEVAAATTSGGGGGGGGH